MIDIKVKKLNENAYLPTKGSAEAAGYDVYATESCSLALGASYVMPLGIAVEIPVGYELQVRPRSGLAAKYGVTVVNSPGTIDSDYRGEVKVLLHRLAGIGPGEPLQINAGDRVAQLVLAVVPESQILETDELSSSDRGAGGLGSTGA